MADKIEDLLHRRTDLSTFLVHLTRDSNGLSARENLVSMVDERSIKAMNPLGMARHLDEYLGDREGTQRVVCFSEAPLEHTWMMVRTIEGRHHEFKPYGLVFSKTTCRRKGCNPVWYLDMSQGTHDWLTKAVDEMVTRATDESNPQSGIPDREQLRKQHILRLTPFIEQMGSWAKRSKEFWWEREWRHVGPFEFGTRQVVAVLAPESAHDDLEGEIDGLDKAWKRRRVPLIDPRWGLERMIAALARIDTDDVGPFP